MRALGIAAVQPLGRVPSREQRYLAYNLMGCTNAELETAHKTLGKCTLIIYISKAFSTLVITIFIIIKFHFGFRTPLAYRNHQIYFEERNDGARKIGHWLGQQLNKKTNLHSAVPPKL